ncbi:MAG: fasciclin domain-containing protein [Flavobacteriales bacterium]|nr:fasciclin domain-containing protein [Flavobacteriales bacterium]
MRKQNISILTILAFTVTLMTACGEGAPASVQDTVSTTPDGGGQSTVQDDQSQKDVVGVAVGSKDHTTLVAAVQAAELVDALSNAGPFTVYAPTNAAFEALPAGTVEGLLKPESKSDLINILEYHVALGVLKPEMLKNGQRLGMVNGQNADITVVDGAVMINGAKVVATVPASNGIVCVIEQVLLPPSAN